MRPVTVTLSGAGVSNPVPLDIYNDPFNVALFLKVSGVNTSDVEYTSDDPFDPSFNPASATWYKHPNMTGLSANADSNLAFPVRAVRLNCTAFTNGSAALTIIQSGIAAAA